MHPDIDDPSHAQTDELRTLALQLAAFTGVLEQRGQQVVQEVHDAAQRLQHEAHDLAGSSERLAAGVIEQIRHDAASTVASGLHQPLEDAGRAMQDGTQQLQQAIRELEERTRRLGKALSAHAWKTFVACAVASLAVIGVAVYVGLQAHRESVRAEWIGQINTAIANGELARCADGGVCARTGSKWVRLGP
jgi:F0F1-type ATP synthase membrane subunit b/b'